MNQGQLVNRIMDATLRGGALTGGNRDQVKEDLNAAIHWVDAILRPVTKTATVAVTANQQDFSILTDLGISDLNGIRDIVYNAVNSAQIWPLEATTPEYIRELRRTFQVTTYINLYSIEGIDTLMLYPASQNTGDTLTIYYTQRQPDLASETDVPSGIPVDFHEVYEVATIMRSMRQSSPEYAAQYRQAFNEICGEYRKWRSKRTGGLAMRVVVGRPGRRMVPHDNSADWRYTQG